MPTKTKSTKKKAAKKAPAKKKTTTSKKKTVRKAVKKTVVKKQQKNEKPLLVCADGAQCFWTCDGKVLSNLIDLSETLNDMADEVFTYHVTKEKNDFADWVENVLADAELGAALRKSARKPASARTVVVRRLKIYAV